MIKGRNTLEMTVKPFTEPTLEEAEETKRQEQGNNMKINGTMLNLEKEIKNIIENDPWTSKEVNNKWVLSHSLRTPERYADMDFCLCGVYFDHPTLSWRIYADALREFGVVLFVEDQVSGNMHTDETRKTVQILIDQYGLRNVTNEFARQIRDKIGVENIKRYIESKKRTIWEQMQ